MVKYRIGILLLLFMPCLIFAKNSTISGFVRDADNGEVLIGANVYIPELKTGNSTNQYGFFSINVPAGDYSIRISFIGYESKELELKLTEDRKIDIELSPKSLTTGTIEVKGEKEDQNIKSVEMGTLNVSPAELKHVPVLFGEQDVLKTIQLMPGVNSATEGNSGFYVRGGGPDENLILLDEAPVYNATHILGFFSVFNSDAINNVKLIKGGGPVEYGGRLSSVLDIKMKEGNRKDFHVSGGTGLISSRLALEGPLGENGSFFISGRRTYADLLMRTFKPDNFKGIDLYFYDLNMKANYSPGEKDHIYLAGYLGRDVFGVKDEFGLDWGNKTATLRWNHIFNNNIFSNTSLIYSKFDYVVRVSNSGSMSEVTSGIEDFNLKQNIFWQLNPQNKISTGFDINYHTFIPGQVSSSGESGLNSVNIDKKYALESAAYAGHEWQMKWLSINYGLRYSSFALLGPGTVYQFDDDGNPFSAEEYSSGKIIKFYGGLEPRLAVNALIDSVSSLKLSYSKNHQYIHLISNNTSRGSMDVWHPGTSIIKPGIADQVSLGYFRNFLGNNYESSVEIYYKKLQNLVDYKDGADLLLNPYVESQLVFGAGDSYGVEIFLKKKFGQFNGWIGYTLSKTERKFPNINDGNPYPAKNDRTHDVSLVLMYQPDEKWEFSANWVYNTGQAVTFPSGKYIIDGKTVNYYTDRNGYRMPDYHRLDLGVTYTFNKSGRFESNISFSLYNAYGRKNPYIIDFREKEDDPSVTQAISVYLFTFFPSLTFNFNW